MAKVKNPNWLAVEYATIFFISNGVNANIPAHNNEINPHILIPYNIDPGNIYVDLNIKYNPAVTIVAECSNDELALDLPLHLLTKYAQEIVRFYKMLLE